MAPRIAWMIAVASLAAGCAKPADSAPETGTPSETSSPTDTDLGDPCDSNPDHVDLVVGKGETGYAPMDDGDGTIELIHGPQGGYHVVIALQGRFFDDSEPAVATMAGFIDGEQLARSLPYVEWRCDGAAGVQLAWNMLLIYDAFPEDLDGRETHIEVTVEDNVGATAYAEADAVIYDPLLH